MARNDHAPGEGELIETTARRRKFWVMAGLFVAGVPCGGYLGYQLGRDDMNLGAPWNPIVALVITGVFLLAMIGGSLLLRKHLDEVEQAVQHRSVATAGALYLLTYPTWFFLWKGGFVAEPIHWVLFVGFWIALMLSSLYYRFR